MSNAFPRMIYKAGGPHEFNDGRFDYLIVGDEAELARELAAGWALTTTQAKAPHAPEPVVEDDDAPPTRAELEAKARELKIKFDGRTNDEKLAGKIAAALRAA